MKLNCDLGESFGAWMAEIDQLAEGLRKTVELFN